MYEYTVENKPNENNYESGVDPGERRPKDED